MLGLNVSLGKPYFTNIPPPEYSMSFDGASDYVSFTETSFGIDDTGDNVSFSFWAKRTDNSSGEAVILGNSATGSYKRLFFDEDDNEDDLNRLYIESDQNGQFSYFTATADTDWHHYVVTITGKSDGYAATVVMYEDGTASTLTNTTNFGSLNDKDFTVDRIGADGDLDSDKEFKGLLYQVAIWDVALDADAVAAIYNSGAPIPLQENKGNYDNSEDLIHLWRWDEGTGSSAADSIGSLTGTIVNATFSSTTPA